MKHVVCFSGGVGSWAAAMRVKELIEPGDEFFLLFADVGGRNCVCGHKDVQHINGRGPCNEQREVDAKYCGCTRFEQEPHEGEDADCYRFITESAKQLGGQLVTLNQGMNIWEIFKKDRFLGNSRLANCSKFLKQRPARKWLEENTTPADSVVYVGIDWTETHRLPAITGAYEPWTALAPLTDPPYLDKDRMLQMCRDAGLEPPAMYKQGFPHANCGGGCVRAGHGQFAMLLEQNPDRYAYWERNEQELRDYLEKDISILRDRSGGVSTPMTLSVFRERLQTPAPDDGQMMIDLDDIGGCGCFID